MANSLVFQLPPHSVAKLLAKLVWSCKIPTKTEQSTSVTPVSPIGGFINALRPSSFAQPLVRAATLQTTVEVVSRSTAVSLSQFGFLSPFATRFFFSTAINEANMPTNVITSAPTGTCSRYLFFDYANMQPNTVYELRVNTDNIPNTALSLALFAGAERTMVYGTSARATKCSLTACMTSPC
jgi:hypothetical protein